METQANTPSTPQVETSNASITNTTTNTVINDKAKYLCTINCAIRRKANTTGLPGQDPAERRYSIGSSLDSKTRSNLKGITGELEKMFMPPIIGVSTNDPTYRKSIEEYWSSISKFVPHDEVFLKEHEKGVVINISFDVIGKVRKEKFSLLDTAEKKIEYLNLLLLTKIKDHPTECLATLHDESVSDYLLLTYCLKYPKVANVFADVDNSPKIDFYIFEKAVAVKNQLTIIELRNTAMQAYQELASDSNKINAVLLMYKVNPKEYDNDTDKVIKIDELYNTAPIENMKKFVDFMGDTNWETKYLINQAISTSKLRVMPNSSAIYYNDVLLGMDMDSACLYLNNDTKGIYIKANLQQEIPKE